MYYSKTTIFAELDNFDAAGWECIIAYGGKYWQDTFEKNNCLLDSDYHHKFMRICDDGSSYLDTSFKPILGSEIYIAPNCPVCAADVRKNYKIKRKPDEGVCNVATSMEKFSSRNFIMEYAVFYNRKIVVVAQERENLLEAMKNFNLEDSPVSFSRDSMTFTSTFIPMVYQMAVLGQLKKPLISYKNLEIKQENELTADQLYIFYKLAIENQSRENIQNFNIQLCALNQTNWRSHLGTMSYLFTELLYQHGKYLKSSCMYNIKNKNYIPSAAREMVKVSRELHEFENNEDLELSRQLLDKIIGIGNVKFTTINKILEKIRLNKLYVSAVTKLYDDVIKLESKKI